MTFTPEQNAALAAKLDRSNVKERTMAGRKMSYVEGWHVIAEANRIFGFDGWTSETVLLQETNRDLVTIDNDRGSYKQWRIGYIAKVRITAGGVSREGTGYGSGMGKPEAVGDAVEGAIKESETDARKRALMTFGNPFGLALYDKDQSEVQNTPAKAPTAVPQAQTPAKPTVAAEAYAHASVKAPVVVIMTDEKRANAKAWALGEIPRIKTLDKAKLDTFCERFAKARIELTALDSKTSVELEKAIADRLEELFA